MRLELLTESARLCVTGGQSRAFFNLIKRLHLRNISERGFNTRFGRLKRFHEIYFLPETYFPEYDLLLRYDFLSFLS